METNCQGLKLLAQIAKKRLKGEIIKTSPPKFTTLRENVRLLPTDEDEKLYAKVCHILSENKDIINPLGKLIDYKKYNNLNGFEREKYFFDLVDKYAELKKKFEKEKAMVV